MSAPSQDNVLVIEATVTSNGRVTLPSAMRKRLGLKAGNRIRFRMLTSGAIEMEPVSDSARALSRMVHEGNKPTGVRSIAPTKIPQRRHP